MRRTLRTTPSPWRRWSLLAAMMLALALMAAACAPGETDPDAADDPDPEEEPDEPDPDDPEDDEEPEDEADADPAELRVTVWTGSDEHLGLFDDIADEFIAEHDTVESVNFDVLPFEDYDDALTVQLAGGNPPDLGWIFERSAPQFIEAGVLADVGPELRESEDYDFDDITDRALELWVEDEAVYGYPFSSSPFAMFYNADMFAEAGLDNPDELYEQGEWTWDAARDAAATIVAEDVAGHGFVVRDMGYELWDNLAMVWRGFGARAWSEDGSQCTMDEPEMVEAMTFFHEAVFEDQAHPAPGQSADFFTGDAAMSITQISRAGLFEDDFEWGVVPLPEGTVDAQVVGQAGVGVFDASENVEAATDFLEFWTNEENSQRMAQFFPPPRESLLTAEILADANPWLDEAQLETVVVNAIEEGEVIPSHVNFAQLRDTIRAELDALWVEDADPEQVLSQVCDAAQPLME